MEQPIISCRDVCFSYHNLKGETLALDHISFQVDKGEFIAIVGPSGCGKSTLLSVIAGLLTPESGEVILDQTKEIRVGYMLQQDHLLEWRSIWKNVLLGPEITGTLTREKEQLAEQLLHDYGLYKFKDKKPGELSGGMKQRAALIRTMVMEPALLLLDEPFSALDYQTRLMVSSDIGSIIRKSGITAILITHDLSEAISLADRILVLTKRPAAIKRTIPVKLTLAEQSPLAARNAPEFNDLFTLLWKEISDEYTMQERFIRDHHRHHHFVTFFRLLIFVLFLLVWEMAGRFQLIDTFFFSSPSMVASYFMEMLQDGSFFTHTGITLLETLISFLLITLISLLAATLLWYSKTLSEILEPYLVVLNSLPKSALAPLFIVWLGTGTGTIIVAGISVAIFGSVISLYTGFKHTDPEKLKLIYTLGGKRMDAFFKVVFPFSIPMILSNMKVNIGLALVGVIIGEFLAARRGLGYLIIYGSQVFKLNMVITSIIILCIIAMGLYQGIQYLEHLYKKKR